MRLLEKGFETFALFIDTALHDGGEIKASEIPYVAENPFVLGGFRVWLWKAMWSSFCSQFKHFKIPFIIKGTKDHVDRDVKCCYLASSSPESTWLTGFLVFSSPFRSELIQLVAVTQKTAERSYRELIEQQIQTYQRRSGDILCSSLTSVRV